MSEPKPEHEAEPKALEMTEDGELQELDEGSSPSSAILESYMERLERLQEDIEAVQHEMRGDDLDESTYLFRAWMQLSDAQESLEAEERSM